MSKIIVFDHDGTLVNPHGPTRFLFDNIETLIKSLKKEGYLLYIWTARSRGSTIEILKSLGIIGAFEEMCCGNDTYPKPDRRGLSQLLEGFSEKEVVVIGDTYIDMIGAKSFGAFAIGALWDKHANKKELIKFGANICASKPEECLSIIKEFFDK